MGARTRYAYEPDYAVPPGATLAETIDSLDMSQRELAIRTGLTPVSVSRIISGEQPLTFETANKLELATGVPARFWNALESQYRERLSKLEEHEQLKADLDWLKDIPVKELQSRGLVGKHPDKVLVLREVLAFYGVSSVAAWKEIWETPKVAARRSACFETLPGAASAWIRQGQLLAKEIHTEPYSRKRFQEALAQIRTLTTASAEVFRKQMVMLCAASGVAAVFVPEMKKVPWNGATMWLSPDKAMIILSLRGKAEDKFWFSFFHEAGHIVLEHSKKELFINDGLTEDPREKEADEFASEQLIPSKYNPAIRNISSHAEIIELADRLGISPGIVAGRFRYLTGQWKFFSKLICRFDWKPEKG